MFKTKKILFAIIICGLALTLLPSFASAAEVLQNPLGKGATLQVIIGRIISAVLGIVGSIALLMFIYGGFMWLTASGNDQRVQKGKDVLTWATIGLAVIFLSYTLVSFVIKGLTKGGTTGGGGIGEDFFDGKPAIGYCKCQSNNPQYQYEGTLTSSECSAKAALLNAQQSQSGGVQTPGSAPIVTCIFTPPAP